MYKGGAKAYKIVFLFFAIDPCFFRSIGCGSRSESEHAGKGVYQSKSSTAAGWTWFLFLLIYRKQKSLQALLAGFLMLEGGLEPPRVSPLDP